MAGDEAPKSWKGALPITYRLGPGFKEPTWLVAEFINNILQFICMLRLLLCLPTEDGRFRINCNCVIDRC